MSFILDALKKSETDRQQQSSAEFAGVPASSDSPGVPRWLWALGLLLAINLAVLLGLLLRTDSEVPDIRSAAIANTSQPTLNEPTPDAQSFSDRVEFAKQDKPARQEPATAAPRREDDAQPASSVTVSPAVSRSAITLPTIHEVVANGTVVLPELHLDIHVYSEVPKDRFVFINMSKLRENSRLTEGPVVEEITPEGVILEYSGTSFLLPRE